MSEAYASLIEARRQLANLRSDTFQIELNELLHKFDTYFKEEFETEQTQKVGVWLLQIHYDFFRSYLLTHA